MKKPKDPELEAHFAKLKSQLVKGQGMPAPTAKVYLEWLKTHTGDETLGHSAK